MSDPTNDWRAVTTDAGDGRRAHGVYAGTRWIATTPTRALADEIVARRSRTPVPDEPLARAREIVEAWKEHDYEGGLKVHEHEFAALERRIVAALAERDAALAAARRALDMIVDLSAGWDENGSTGPRCPLSWESVGRLAMDYARAALAPQEREGGAHER